MTSLSFRRWQRRPRPIQVIAALLIPIQLLSYAAPLALLAQNTSGTAETAETPIDFSAGPLLVPDSALLAAAAQSVFVPVDAGTAEAATPPAPMVRAGRDLPENPTTAEVQANGITGSALRPLGAVRAADNTAVAGALRLYAQRPKHGDVSALTDWLKATPASLWKAAVLQEVGRTQRQWGYLARGQTALQQAWQAAKGGQSLAERELASDVAGELATALVETGDVPGAKALFTELNGRALFNPGRTLVTVAKEHIGPEIMGGERSAIPCGLESIVNMFAILKKHSPPYIVFSEATQKLWGLSADERGTMTLDQVQKIGELAHLKVLPMHRVDKNAPFPTPSILHWKNGHFAAVQKRVGDQYLVYDSNKGGKRWMESAALLEECSDVALTEKIIPPDGWEVARAGLAAYRGRCSSSAAGKKNSKKCAKKSGGSGCSSCKGMAGYTIDLAECSLRVTDTPFSYAPSRGPSIDFTIDYSQRQTDTVASHPLANVGKSITFTGASWIDLSEVTLSVTPVTETWQYDSINHEWVAGWSYGSYEWSGSAKVWLAGGGYEEFKVINLYGELQRIAGSVHGQFVDPTDYSQIQSLRFGRDRESGARLEATDANGNDLTSNVGDYHNGLWLFAHAYRHVLTDGAVESFRPTSPGSTLQKLTKVHYPDGPEIIYNYSGRLNSIQDVDQRLTTFQYQSDDPAAGAAYLQIKKVTDPFGRSAQFVYDGINRLTKSIDPSGIESVYGYAGESDVMSSLTTPYGITTFATGEDSYNGIRWVEATDPLGARERVEWRSGAIVGLPVAETTPQGMSIDNNSQLNRCNTYYWSKRAMQQCANDPHAHYDYAHIYHWGLDTLTASTNDFLVSEKQPLESRIWYWYGSDASSDAPLQVGRVLSDGSTQLRKYEYDDSLQVTKETDPLGRETKYTYNGPDLQKVEQKTGMNGTQPQYATLVEYGAYSEAYHRPLTVTDAAGQVTTYTYTAEGQVATVTRQRDGNSETTTYLYNGQKRLQEIHAPNQATLASFTYDPMGRTASRSGPDGYTLRYSYDILDRPVQTIYPDGTYEQKIYDKLDAAWLRDREGRWTKTEHDALRRNTAVTDPLNRKTQFDWCECGTLDGLIDAKNQRTSFFYDLQGRMTSKVYADNTATSYQYDSSTSRLSGMSDARGQWTRYEYFGDNKLKKVRYSNAAGSSLEQIRSDGTKINATVEYAYDTVYDRVTSMTDGTGITNYAYYPISSGTLGAGRLSTVTGPLPNPTIAYNYDAYGRMTQRSIGSSGNTLTRTYDALGRVSSETNPLSTFTYQYVGQTRRLQEMSTPTGFRTAFEYWPGVPSTAGDGNGDFRLKGIKHYRNTSTLADEYDYTYTPAGDVAQWTQSSEGLNPASYALGYDPADQLTSAVKTESSIQTERWGWRYDAAANRTTEQLGFPQGGSNVTLTQASYNNVNQLTSRTGGSGSLAVEGTVSEPATVKINNVPVDSLTAKANGTYQFQGKATVASGNNTVTVTATDGGPNTTTASKTVAVGGTAIPSLTYDTAGNLTSDGTSAYVWDAASRLVQITYLGTGNRTEFTYDGKGRRVRIRECMGNSVTNDIRCIWEGIAIAEERSSDTNNVKACYFAQGERQSFNQSISYFYRRDHLGSVRELTDATGALVVRYQYDFWGRRTVLTSEPAATTNVGYTGHWTHERSAMNLTAYRVYCPESGRWLSRDPLGHLTPKVRPALAEQLPEGPNLYAYAGNASSTKADPLGLACGSGTIQDIVIPDKPGGFDFTAACEQHDSCYGTCHRKKKDCDDQFYNDMVGVCNGIVNPTESASCKRVAGIYHSAVKNKGQDPYDRSQLKACKCDRQPFPNSEEA